MSDIRDLTIKCMAFGFPSKESAYLSITSAEGGTFRFHFNGKRQISFIRSESSKAEDQWRDEPSG